MPDGRPELPALSARTAGLGIGIGEKPGPEGAVPFGIIRFVVNVLYVGTDEHIRTGGLFLQRVELRLFSSEGIRDVTEEDQA